MLCTLRSLLRGTMYKPPVKLSRTNRTPSNVSVTSLTTMATQSFARRAKHGSTSNVSIPAMSTMLREKSSTTLAQIANPDLSTDEMRPSARDNRGTVRLFTMAEIRRRNDHLRRATRRRSHQTYKLTAGKTNKTPRRIENTPALTTPPMHQNDQRVVIVNRNQ